MPIAALDQVIFCCFRYKIYLDISRHKNTTIILLRRKNVYVSIATIGISNEKPNGFLKYIFYDLLRYNVHWYSGAHLYKK